MKKFPVLCVIVIAVIFFAGAVTSEFYREQSYATTASSYFRLSLLGIIIASAILGLELRISRLEKR